MAELLHDYFKNWLYPESKKVKKYDCPLCTKLVTSFKRTKFECHVSSTNLQDKTTPEYITLYATYPI